MKAQRLHTAEQESWLKRLLRKPALPALIVTPVLSLALLSPAVAVAADSSDAAAKSSASAPAVQTQSAPTPAPQVNTVERGTLTLCDDPFSVEAPAAAQSAPEPIQVVSEPISETPVQNVIAPTSDDAITMIAAPQEVSKAQSATNPGNEPTASAAPTYNAQNEAGRSSAATMQTNAKTPKATLPVLPTASSGDVNETVSAAFESMKSMATKPLALASAQQPSALVTESSTGKIDFFDSHPANVTFRATTGGTVSKGASDAGSTGGNTSSGMQSFTEHYPDSLTGVSGGATAINQPGYHFAYWIDTLTGAIVSTSTSFTPSRPESGWPAEWVFEAVFIAEMPEAFVILLDPNGGTAGGGGGSPGAVRMEVKTGSNFSLPMNDSENVQFAKAGCTFTGWNTLANPDAENASGSIYFSDGQLFDSATETRAFAALDWSNPTMPILTLYAQWSVSISYVASTGGSVISNAASTSSPAKTYAESFDVHSGKRGNDSTNVGPDGVRAVPNDRMHFNGWTVEGTSKQMTETEAENPNLSSSVVTRLSRYTESDSASAEYHPVTFTATFAPNTYVIKYGSNGGSGTIQPQSVTYGSASTAIVASSGVTREGYTLSGWNLVSNGSGRAFSAGEIINMSTIESLISSGALDDADNASATLYAQWTKVEEPKEENTDSGDAGNEGDSNDKKENADSNDDKNNNNSGNDDNSGDTPIDNPADDNGGNNADDNTEEAPTPIPTKPTPTPASPNANASSWIPVYYPPVYSAESNTSEAPSQQASAVMEASAEPVSSILGGIEIVEAGLLSATSLGGRSAGSTAPIIPRESGGAGAYGAGVANNASAGALDSLMTPEGMQEAGTTVAAVAAVGAVASLVGVGVSVAGAAMVGAATIGTAGAIGLTSAADLAADLAAASAAGAAGAGAAAKRRRRGEDDAESSEQE